jgi:hypothetical protein
MRLIPRLLPCGIALFSLPLANSVAATFNVTSTVDAIDINPGNGICETSVAGECTIRAAIQEANALVGSDDIEVPAGTYILNIVGQREDAAATGDLDVADDAYITGAGAGSTVIDANSLDRALDILAAADVSITNLTIQNGDLGFAGAFAEHGGGIRNSGSLVLDTVVVKDSSAGDFGIGGGIFNRGMLKLVNVEVVGNSADRTGGVASLSNTDFLSPEATLENVTIANNTSVGGTAGMWTGAGVDYLGQRASASLLNVTITGNVSGLFTTSAGGFENRDDAILVNVTITNNAGFFAGGIASPFASPATPVTLIKNTIVANNVSALGRNCSAVHTSLGNNLSSDESCNFTSSGDVVNTDPHLGSLEDNGGLTRTHALLAGSPAIDAGSLDCPPPSTDQRGYRRPVDGDGDGSDVCDIGAFEFGALFPATPVAIDIKPGGYQNAVNPRNRGVIPVAVLGSTEFDATQVDIRTVQLGTGGTRPKHDGHVADFNRDGFPDLLFHFPTPDTGIQCGTSEITLTGMTFAGEEIVGSDTVRTVGCK